MIFKTWGTLYYRWSWLSEECTVGVSRGRTANSFLSSRCLIMLAQLATCQHPSVLHQLYPPQAVRVSDGQSDTLQVAVWSYPVWKGNFCFCVNVLATDCSPSCCASSSEWWCEADSSTWTSCCPAPSPSPLFYFSVGWFKSMRGTMAFQHPADLHHPHGSARYSQQRQY